MHIFITFAIVINFFYLQQIKLILVFYKFEFISFLFTKIIKINRNTKTVKKNINMYNKYNIKYCVLNIHVLKNYKYLT